MKTSKLFERVTTNWPAKILSIVAAVLLFLFYRISTLQERYITVPLQAVPNEQLAPAIALPRVVQVALRGKADTIFLVREEEITASIDLSTYDAEGSYRVPVRIEKSGNALAADIEVKVTPLEVPVTLEKKVRKSVQIFPRFRGSPAKGYELSEYAISPDHVDITGPRTRVASVTGLSTREIDLTGRTTDFTVNADLAVQDPTIQIAGDNQIDFHGIVRPITVVKTLEPIDVVALDLDPGLLLHSDSTTGSVQIQGTQNDVDKISPGDVTLDVLCSQIRAPGAYTLPTKPSVPQGITVLGFSPERVTLTITRGVGQ